jgi:D-beta-D-heptose 7-phosphate kinase/D-beta-D-heptose 1-phosphate adenosyltransferase
MGWRRMDKCIVFTNGCFDLFHVGHLHILRESSKLGDELYVGVNSDNSIKKIKGKNRPIINEVQRLEIISSIKYVTKAILFDEETPIKLIEHINPNIIVKGGDYNKEDIVGADLAKVVIIPLIDDISTSDILKKINMIHRR